ncbi:MAG TPA: lysyl oxidase family protein, partial [Polyangiaceae bacterium]|nr:lysyl oxidase family protein [Polyangiaceae bacterium]
EKNLDSSVILSLVPVGSYTSFLQEGWRLERVDGAAILGESVLLSPNPDSFEVRDGERTPLVLRFQVGPDEVANDRGSGLLEVGVEVNEPASSTLCSKDAECAEGQVCCVSGRYGSCHSLGAGEACPLPDLTVSAEAATESLLINEEYFAADSCAIEEGCVVEPGVRRLLRFSTMTPNVGAADLVLGDPSGTPGFEFAPCHGHFHFQGYARYELIDELGAVVATGHKQAFCLLDSLAVGLPGAPATPRFHCGFQGIQRGWADVYDAALDCQWVDITNVPAGEYLLRISINSERVVVESDYGNNSVEVPVTVVDP